MQIVRTNRSCESLLFPQPLKPCPPQEPFLRQALSATGDLSRRPADARLTFPRQLRNHLRCRCSARDKAFLLFCWHCLRSTSLTTCRSATTSLLGGSRLRRLRSSATTRFRKRTAKWSSAL